MSRRARNLELNLGKACNNRCIFCLDGNARPEARRWVPVDRARGELERARAQGARSVGLLGGEPTAHPSVLEIVAMAREMGFERIALATNALKLRDAELCRALVEAGATRFSLSIHAHRAADEDYLTGREGNFARKLAAVRNLVSLRDAGAIPHNVSVNAVLTRRIHASLPELLAFFRREGIRDVRFNMIRTDACPELGEELTPRLSELTPAILRAVAVARTRLGTQVSFGDLPLCAYPWEVLRNPGLASRVVGESRDLDTWVAVFHAPRDTAVDAHRFKWSEKKRHALKLQPEEPCARCRAVTRCEGLWRSYHLLYGAAELSPL
jgi:MoaA/NifB/PqqE/SkfB family radical SAM enzyme